MQLFSAVVETCDRRSGRNRMFQSAEFFGLPPAADQIIRSELQRRTAWLESCQNSTNTVVRALRATMSINGDISLRQLATVIENRDQLGMCIPT
jgi:hypothetical protein